MTDTVKVLSDDEVAEIRSTLERLAAPGEPWESKTEKVDTFQNISARHALSLCATVRALRSHEWNAERVLAWLDDPNGKPAIHAFTAGNERQIAYRFERLRNERDELQFPVGPSEGGAADRRRAQGLS